MAYDSFDFDDFKQKSTLAIEGLDEAISLIKNLPDTATEFAASTNADKFIKTTESLSNICEEMSNTFDDIKVGTMQVVSFYDKLDAGVNG